MFKINIPKRGYKKDLPTLNFCELGYCIDADELYMGSPNGNVLLEGECFSSTKEILFKMYGGRKENEEQQ